MNSESDHDDNEIRATLRFRSLDASNNTSVSLLKTMSLIEGHAPNFLSIMNPMNKTTTHATFQKNFKLAIVEEYASEDEPTVFDMLIMFLIKFCDIPADFFEGDGVVEKRGLCSFPHNEHGSSIRLWSTKKIGNDVIYELTVSSYKNAIPKPWSRQ
jgi:hypothetical protein